MQKTVLSFAFLSRMNRLYKIIRDTALVFIWVVYHGTPLESVAWLVYLSILQSVLLKTMKSRKLSRMTGSEFRFIRGMWVFDTPKDTEFFGGLRFGYTRGYWVQFGVWGPSFWGPSFRDTRSCNKKNASRPSRLKFTFLCIRRTRLKKEIHHLLWEMRG